MHGRSMEPTTTSACASVRAIRVRAVNAPMPRPLRTSTGAQRPAARIWRSNSFSSPPTAPSLLRGFWGMPTPHGPGALSRSFLTTGDALLVAVGAGCSLGENVRVGRDCRPRCTVADPDQS